MNLGLPAISDTNPIHVSWVIRFLGKGRALDKTLRLKAMQHPKY